MTLSAHLEPTMSTWGGVARGTLCTFIANENFVLNAVQKFSSSACVDHGITLVTICVFGYTKSLRYVC